MILKAWAGLSATEQGIQSGEDAGKFLLREIGTGGQAETDLEQVLADLLAKVRCICKVELKMHGFPKWAGFDIESLQAEAYSLTVQPVVGFRIHEDGSQPTVVERTFRFFLEADVTSLGARKRAVWMRSLSLPSRAPTPLVGNDLATVDTKVAPDFQRKEPDRMRRGSWQRHPYLNAVQHVPQ